MSQNRNNHNILVDYINFTLIEKNWQYRSIFKKAENSQFYLEMTTANILV